MSHGYTLLRQAMAYRLFSTCVEVSAWLRAPLTLVGKEIAQNIWAPQENEASRSFEDLNEFMTIGVGVSPFHAPEFA